MAGEEGLLRIRSFRLVFDLERRIYSIDGRWRVPAPQGIPLKAIGYFLGAFLALVVLNAVPVLCSALGNLYWGMHYIVIPFALAYAMYGIKVDGRGAHHTLMALARHRLSPKRLVCFRAVPEPGSVVRLGEVVCRPDLSTPRYRRCEVSGDGTLHLRYPADARLCGETLYVEQTSDRPLQRARSLKLGSGEPVRRVVFR